MIILYKFCINSVPTIYRQSIKPIIIAIHRSKIYSVFIKISDLISNDFMPKYLQYVLRRDVAPIYFRFGIF